MSHLRVRSAPPRGPAQSSSRVEALEGRRHLSASAPEILALAADVHPSAATIELTSVRAVSAAARSGRASLVPADLPGNYGGSYNATTANSFGDVELSVTGSKKSQFFGTLTFIELDGNTVAGSFKAKMGRNYSIKLTMKSGRTAIKATGQYHPGFRPGFVMTMSGRFDGQKMGRFGLGGAFAVMKGLGV